eukprot:TRINITY_DN9443_c0_g1_i1.p1 TRINITY_DN9443_c0_g1~~TRINITY_DN9443_c0_g1_i1.p1  ORF type:complete len:645 (-),score=77.44 TRINITY_DN9443_c0_g1_i1:45-1979(-)
MCESDGNYMSWQTVFEEVSVDIVLSSLNGENVVIPGQERLKQLIDKYDAGEFDDWKEFPVGMVAAIILLGFVSDKNDHHAEALSLSEIYLSDRRFLSAGAFAPLHLCYVLYPFVQSKDVKLLISAMEKLNATIMSSSFPVELLHRFKKVTLMNFLHVDYSSKHLGYSDADEILEHKEFTPSDALRETIPRHPLSIAISDFLETRPGFGTLAISLSGGVDSMVIARILVALRDANPQYAKIHIVGIHINYNNRPESDREAQFVEGWCSRHGIDFIQTKITEFTRGVTKREIYECETKKIRFGMYKKVLTDYNNCLGIIFGHHMGDKRENVLTNVFTKNSSLAITGMKVISMGIMNVPIWRPLLKFDKPEIFKFAHQFGVPYFLDTTPKWSNRGRMRNELIPLLTTVFGENVLADVIRSGKEFDRTQELVTKHILKKFLQEKVICGKVGLWFALDAQTLAFPRLLWREIFKVLFHAMGFGDVRKKALDNFVRLIQRKRDKSKQGSWIGLRQECMTLLLAQKVYIFSPAWTNSFRCHTKTKPLLETTNIQLPCTLGMWDVSCQDLAPTNIPNDTITIFDIINGDFSYILTTGLTTVNFNATPQSMQNIPKKICSIIPFLTSQEGKNNTNGPSCVINYCFRAEQQVVV